LAFGISDVIFRYKLKTQIYDAGIFSRMDELVLWEWTISR
jgi:hypothetical protein